MCPSGLHCRLLGLSVPGVPRVKTTDNKSTCFLEPLYAGVRPHPPQAATASAPRGLLPAAGKACPFTEHPGEKLTVHSKILFPAALCAWHFIGQQEEGLLCSVPENRFKQDTATLAIPDTGPWEGMAMREGLDLSRGY